LIEYVLQLRHGALYTSIMEAVHDYMEDGFNQKKSIRMALRKYRHQWEEYLERDDEENNNDEDGNDTDDNEEAE